MTIAREIKSPAKLLGDIRHYELSMSKGVQAKFFDAQEDMWYKQDCLGTEGLSEYVASKLLEHSGADYVSYVPCSFKMGAKEVVGCKSCNFLKNGERLISTYKLIKDHLNIDIAKEIVPMDIEGRIRFFVDTVERITGMQDFGTYITNMLQLDAVTKNDDRHFNNISLILDCDGHYRPSPIYDNGAAFLSDQYTYGENLSLEQAIDRMDQVKAKPFSLDFDEQLDICERLYPSTLHLQKNVRLDEEMLKQFYSDNEIEVAKTVLRQSQRKYSYLFEVEYTETRSV